MRLEKDGGGVTVVFSERSRGAHIPKDKGPRFQWCDKKKMHISIETAAAVKTNARQEQQRDFAVEVFCDCPEAVGLTWAQVHERIKEMEGIGQSGGAEAFREDARRQSHPKKRREIPSGMMRFAPTPLLALFTPL